MISLEIRHGTAAVWVERGIILLLLLVSFGKRSIGVEGLAIKETFYANNSCEVETTHTLQFGLIVVDSREEWSLAPFNTCHENEDLSGSVLTCNPISGSSGSEKYTDPQCTEVDPSEGFQNVAECAVCGSGLSCGVTTVCTEAEPTAIAPSTTYNVIGIQFTDPECKDPTGVEEIVSPELFQNCRAIYIGGPNYLEACPRKGLLVTQQFLPADTTCSGEVVVETSFDASISMDSADAIMDCLTYEIDGFYYGYYECTTDPATVGPRAQGITPSPAESSVVAATPVPSAVNSSDSAITLVPSDAVTSSPMAGNRGSLIEDTPSPSAVEERNTTTPGPSVGVPGVVTSGSSSEEEEQGEGAVDSLDTPAPSSSENADGLQAGTSGSAAAFIRDRRIQVTAVSSCALGLALLYIM